MLVRKFRLISILLGTLLFLTCCATTDNEKASISTRIDSAGGTVLAPDGAEVEIPPDAIDESLDVSVTTYASVADMPSKYHSSLVGANGVADFGPDGTVFKKSVRITIPSPHPLKPGDEYALFMWNEDEGAWQETEFIARVDPNGASYSAYVTHFTTYTGSVQPGPSFFEPLLDWEFFPPKVSKLEEVFRIWTEWFPSETDRQLTRLWRLEDCCWEEVGLLFRFNVSLKGEELFSGTKQVPSELPTDYDWREYIEKHIRSLDTGLSVSASVVIYWNSKVPDVSLSPSSSKLTLSCDKEPQQDLTIFAKCGDEGVPEAFIDIFVDSGPGEVVPENIRTDAEGQASVIYKPDKEGIAVIAGQISTCQQEPEPFRENVDGAICVEECKDWHVTLKTEFTHSGGDVSWKLMDHISAIIPFRYDPKTGEVTAQSAQASQFLSVEAIDPECSILNASAPSFGISLTEPQVLDGIFSFGILPEQIPLSFTWFCKGEDDDEPLSYSVPNYGNLIGSAIGKEFIYLELPFECTGRRVGLPENNTLLSEGFDEFDMPLTYYYQVDLIQACEDDKCSDY